MPENGQQVDLTVHLPGLVEIFGNHLYREFADIVRELVQNGHDAIVQDVSSFHDAGRRRVDVVFHQNSCLVVNDTGKGLTNAELVQDLNNFARSAKGEFSGKAANRSCQAWPSNHRAIWRRFPICNGRE